MSTAASARTWTRRSTPSSATTSAGSSATRRSSARRGSFLRRRSTGSWPSSSSAGGSRERAQRPLPARRPRARALCRPARTHPHAVLRARQDGLDRALPRRLSQPRGAGLRQGRPAPAAAVPGRLRPGRSLAGLPRRVPRQAVRGPLRALARAGLRASWGRRRGLDRRLIGIACASSGKERPMSGFRKFLLRGNVVDLAVAVVIGAAFGAVVTALVKDIITPIIAAIGGTPDFSSIYFTINGSRFLIGDFINAVVAFVLIAVVVYYLVVLPMNRLMELAKP